MDRYKTQGYGETKIDYSKFDMKFHNGEDYAVELGSDIYPAHEGIVTLVQKDDTFGWGVEITSLDKTFKTRYWHMKKGSIAVELNQNVDISTKFGEVNNTGFSFGNHVHFDFKELDENGIKNYDNGAFGAIDPTPYKKDLPMEKLTKEQVERFYVIAGLGLGDTDAINYWTGKTLDELFDARLRDLKKEVEAVQ